MMFQNSAHTYARPIPVGVRQNLARRNGWELPGGVLLWKTAGKMAAAGCLLVLLVQLLQGMYLGSLEQAARIAEEQRHTLMDANISLRAERAALSAPEQIELVAADMLSLHAPDKGQVYKYNRRTGRFARL